MDTYAGRPAARWLNPRDYRTASEGHATAHLPADLCGLRFNVDHDAEHAELDIARFFSGAGHYGRNAEPWAGRPTGSLLQALQGGEAGRQPRGHSRLPLTGQHVRCKMVVAVSVPVACAVGSMTPSISRRRDRSQASSITSMTAGWVRGRAQNFLVGT